MGEKADGVMNNRNQRKQKPSTFASAASGAVSGALISVCVQPLDVLRTRMQADAAKGVFRGTLGTLETVMAQGGLRLMWAGTAPTVMRLALGAGMHFTLLENMKSMMQVVFKNTSDTLPPLQAAAAGGLSRAFAGVLLCPLTVVKTRMEYSGADAIRYRNVLHAMQTIVATEGPRSLYRGLAPTVLTNAPFSALYYMFYTQLKKGLADDQRPQMLVNFTSGLVAAVGATVLTQPTDFVRTRAQLSPVNGVARASTLALLGQSFREHGGKAIMSGVVPRALKRTAQTALIWTLYEELVPRLTAAVLWVSAQRGAEGHSLSGAGIEGKG